MKNSAETKSWRFASSPEIAGKLAWITINFPKALEKTNSCEKWRIFYLIKIIFRSAPAHRELGHMM
jgi:hypothetical protein